MASKGNTTLLLFDGSKNIYENNALALPPSLNSLEVLAFYQCTGFIAFSLEQHFPLTVWTCCWTVCFMYFEFFSLSTQLVVYIYDCCYQYFYKHWMKEKFYYADLSSVVFIGFPVLINFSFIIWSYGNLKQSELFVLELCILGDDPVFHNIIFFIMWKVSLTSLKYYHRTSHRFIWNLGKLKTSWNGYLLSFFSLKPHHISSRLCLQGVQQTMATDFTCGWNVSGI